MSTPRQQVWVQCGHCEWVWACYAPLPAPVEIVCRAMMMAVCPSCDVKPKKLLVAKEADIAAALAKAGAP